jgi:hypothetical protein
MTRLGQAGKQSPTVGNGHPNGAPIESIVTKPRTGEPSPAEYRQAFERLKVQGPRGWGPRFGPYPDQEGYRGPAIIRQEYLAFKAQQAAIRDRLSEDGRR